MSVLQLKSILVCGGEVTSDLAQDVRACMWTVLKGKKIMIELTGNDFVRERSTWVTWRYLASKVLHNRSTDIDRRTPKDRQRLQLKIHIGPPTS